MVSSLGWLITMRWFAGAGVLAAPLAAGVLGLQVPKTALVVVGLVILGYNAALWWRLAVLNRAGTESAWPYDAFGRVQIGLDWAAMVALTALSGGIESPVIVFFLFHISIASLLLEHTRAFLYFALPPAMVALVAVFEYAGVLPHVALFGAPRFRDPVFVGLVWFFFTAACYGLAYFCIEIADRLRRRENELSGLFEAVRDATASLDLQTVLDRLVESATRVLECKGAAIRLLDREKAQVAFAATFGLSEAYVEEVPQDYRRARLDQATLAGQALFVNDAADDPRVWHPQKVKKEGIESMLSVPLVGKDGPLGVLRAYGGEGHRFTDEDASFLEVVAANGAVAIENAQAYRLLQELDHEKSRFVRVATHELRSPASVAESLLTALAEGYAGELPAAQVDVVRRALRRVQALKTLVNDLLDLASGRADLKSSERRRVPFASILSEVCDRFQVPAKEKGITLAFDDPSDPLEVWADPADIERMTSNLVGNAVKYTLKGGVRVALSREGETLKLEVSDSGIGIPADSLSHLFQEFYRARNAKALEEAGTGLGLAIIKDMVDRYAGKIDVQSTEGVGTTFTVTFPLCPADPPHVAAPA